MQNSIDAQKRKLILLASAYFLSEAESAFSSERDKESHERYRLPTAAELNELVKRDRTLFLYEKSLAKFGGQKVFEFPFFRDGAYNRAVYEDLCWLTMDKHEKVAVEMDIGLFNIAALTQMHLWDITQSKRPMRFTSGYRTYGTNSRIEGASKNSYHMQAKGLDFTVEGVDKYAVAHYTRYFGAGGVGVYSTHNHIDTGAERAWDFSR